LTPEEFFAEAYPIAEQRGPASVVVWWRVKGQLVRAQLAPPDSLELSVLEPNSPGMEELLEVIGEDRLLDAMTCTSPPLSIPPPLCKRYID